MSAEKTYNFEPIKDDILCCHKTTASDPPFLYHRHNGCEIYLFLRGNVNFYLENTCYHLVPGDLSVVNSQEMHRTVCLDNQVYERISINIKQSVMEALSTAKTDLSLCFFSHPLGENNMLHLSDEKVREFIHAADCLEHCVQSDTYGADVYSKIYLMQLLVLVNDCYLHSQFCGTSIMPETIKELMVYIKEHLTENITLSGISDTFHLNGTYISRKFKQHTGLTLRKYILDRRIAQAKHLLKEGCNVSEACYGSGFSDYANFIRQFSKEVGMSPGKYRLGCS